VAEFFSSLVRGVLMLMAGAVVLLVAAVLMLFTLAFVLVALVRGALTGNRPSAQAQWGRFRESPASQVWQRYRAAASAGRPAQAGQREEADVEDVPFRELATRPPVAEPESRPRHH
jgi:type IV secretory pathway VirB6-like protein